MPRTVASPFLSYRLTRAVCIAIAAGMVGAFLLFVASAIASEGVCCADDGIYATMAKNLAAGLGFSTTLQPDNTSYKVLPFDPQAGGPSVIVPAAILIRILGNQYWVPGLAATLLWLFCFSASGYLLRCHVDVAPAGVATGVFTGLVFALFPYHFEHWYALLGEVPASGFILLAVIAWALKPEEPRQLVFVGTLLGLAVLSKALAFLWFGVLLASAGANAWFRRNVQPRWWTSVAVLSLGFAIPIGAFELWKLVALGWERYYSVQRAAFSFLILRGAAHGGETRTVARVLAKSESFHDRFALPLAVLLLAAMLATGIVWLRSSFEFRRMSAALLAGLLVHATWWLAVSDGRPRYMVIALVPAAFLICLPIATAKRPLELLGVAIAVIVLSTPTWRRLGYPPSRIRFGRFEASERNRHSLEVTRFLEREAAGRIVFTEWWAMVSALDYESETRIRFQPLGAAAARDPRKSFFVVLDDRFLNWSGQSVGALVAPCGPPVLNRAPYRVFDCR